MASFDKENSDNSISILRAESSENNSYTEYVIEVGIGAYQWIIRHRYSEFHELNEKLVAGHGLEKKLLPPKKAFGNTSEAFIQKRRCSLERYLQTVLKQFDRVPYELATFLDFQKYEVNGVTQILAETLYTRGDALLQKSSICSMDPLQLHSISTRMTQPETVVSTQQRDIGHILDFITMLKRLRIIGTDKAVGTSNINMNNLEYNLAMFKGLTYLELMKCNVTKLNGLDHVRKNITKLKVKKSLTDVQEFLTHNSLHWEAENEGGAEAVTASLTWPELTWVDMSENDIAELPPSMRYLEKMEYLDLHDNYLESIQNLESSSYLTHIDLSLNKIESLTDLHLKLGNIKTLNLSGNKLETLIGFSKLYSLEYLDVSNNQISQVIELRYLGSLPLLENLIIQGNPVTVIPDYRIQVLKIFEGRAKEVSLDNKKATDQELDTVAVLIALDHAKRPANGTQQSTGTSSSRTLSTELTLSAEVAPAAGATSEHVSQQSETDDLSVNGNNETLNTSALQERLQGLSQQLTHLDTSIVNSRFDSPFNSPTRSSLESDQQFHSLNSTPKEPVASADDIEGSAEDTPTVHIHRASPDGAAINHSPEKQEVASDEESVISSPSPSFSVNSEDINGDDEEENDSLMAEDAEHKTQSSPETQANGEVQATHLTVEVQPGDLLNDSHTSLSPLNVSIDVVDHLEKCIACIPNTIKLKGALNKLTQMDGEELLNLFYHGSVIRQAGDSKEELCHAMWTSLTKYNCADAEQPSLVLLSNQATYFIMAGDDPDKYSVCNIRHQDLEEVCIGPYHQSVRLGGLTETDYYCCITRDPSLVHVFTTRVAFIVDTDFVKSPAAVKVNSSDSEEEASIYDTQEDSEDRLEHPSGVRFIHDEEKSLEDMKNFLMDSCGAEDVKLISTDFIHLSTSTRLQPFTLCLTDSAIYLVEEMYANHPMPKCSKLAPHGQIYVLERVIRIEDIENVTLNEHSHIIDLRTNEESLSITYSSRAMSTAFLANCSPLLTS